MIECNRTKRFSAEDWSRIRAICCDTGRSGEPIEENRRPFFGEHWVGPYQALLPDWVYIYRDDQSGEILGYLTGCPDSKRFERQKLKRFVPKLVARVLSRRFEWNEDTKRFLKRAFKVEKAPDQFFSKGLHRKLERDFPAHLHINFDARARGKGAGRALIDAFVADLRERGVPGLHVHCGEKPVPFYLKTGFVELERREFRPGVWVFVLARPVT